MAYVCSCHGITDRTVRAALASGARSVEDVISACRAGASCGGCHPTIEALAASSETRVGPLRRVSAA